MAETQTLERIDQDLELVSLLGSIDEPKCHYRPAPAKQNPQCGASATWMVALSCGCDGCVCDDHKEKTDIDFTNVGGAYDCPKHKMKATPRWEKI